MIVIILALFMIMLDVSVVTVALTEIGKDLGADTSSVSWVLNAYTLIFASCLILAGRLGDNFGIKRVFLAGLIIFALSSLACALAPNIALLIVMRLVQAFGAALIMPATLSLVTLAFPANKRGMAMGIWGTTSGLASALGPAIGGVLTQSFGWRSIFYLNLPISILAVLGALIWIQDSKSLKQKLDIFGAVLSILMLLFFTLGLTLVAEQGFTSLAQALFILSVIFFIVFLLREKEMGSQALLDLALFREGSFSIGVLVGFFLMFGMMGVFYILPLFWQTNLNFSPAQAGIALMPMTLSMLVATPLVGVLTDKISPKIIMIIGSVLAVLGCAGLSYFIFSHIEGLPIMLVLLIAGIGMALLQTPLTATVMASLPASKSGSGSSALTTARQLGSLIIVALITLTIGQSASGGQNLIEVPANSAALSLIYVSVGYLICVALLLFMKKEKIEQIVNRKSESDNL